MRIIVTNDDGINAPGLKVLEKIAATLSRDVWVVAPELEQSGASHSLTLTQPLRIREIGPKRFAVNGTPTDCAMIAVAEILKGKKGPDLLLSGVNRGANIAEDVTYSGTIAAAMEGTLLGVPSLALSQVFAHGHPVKWTTAETHGPKVVKKLLKTGWPKGVLLNINFPDVLADSVNGVEIATQGQRDTELAYFDRRVDMRNVPYYWLGFRRDSDNPPKGSDLSATARGYVSVTPLQLDLTCGKTLKALTKAFS